jgi:hypothetical protein
MYMLLYMGVTLGTFGAREDYRVTTFLNRMLRRTLAHKAKGERGNRIHFHSEEFHNLNSSSGTRNGILITVIFSPLL